MLQQRVRARTRALQDSAEQGQDSGTRFRYPSDSGQHQDKHDSNLVQAQLEDTVQQLGSRAKRAGAAANDGIDDAPEGHQSAKQSKEEDVDSLIAEDMATHGNRRLLARVARTEPALERVRKRRRRRGHRPRRGFDVLS